MAAGSPDVREYEPREGTDVRSRRVLVASGSAELYGSDRVLLETVCGLVEHGHRVVFVTGDEGPLRDRMHALGVPSLVRQSPVLRRSYLSPTGLLRFALLTLQTIPGMLRVVTYLRPDVVYVNTTTLPFWSLVARSCGRPVVVHVHEAESGQARPLRRVLATALRAATGVLFNSRTSLDLAVADAIGPLPPSAVVPNPVAPPAVTTAAREELDGALRVLYVGRISARKGVDVALQAVADLASSGRDVTLDVVGDVFPGYEEFGVSVKKRATEPDLDGRVTFHGFDADIAPYLDAADLVVVPSRSDESFGNVLVEAVSAGRPVVAAAQTGLCEASQGLRSVVLVQPGDAHALSAGIDRVAREWATYRRSAGADAVTVRARHDPRRFRRCVVESIVPAVSPASELSSGPPLTGDGVWPSRL